VTLKAQNLEAALPEIVDRDLVDVFVGLGNGLVQDRVAALVGRERLVAGIVEWGATNLAPGHLSQTTRNVFVVGELDGPARERTDRLAVCSDGRRDTCKHEHSRPDLVEAAGQQRVFGARRGRWRALSRRRAHAAGRRALCALWSEGHRVGLAEGLELEPVLGIPATRSSSPLTDRRPGGFCAHRRALETALALAGATKASMLQDVERGH